MNKREQLEYIEQTCPLYINHISKRRIRHNFFNSIDTEIQAYLLGFYSADGSVDEKRKTLRIHLSSKDDEIIYLYKDIVAPDSRIFEVEDGYKTTGRNGVEITGHGSKGIDITSSELVQDIIKYGFSYNKTYNDSILPSINNDLLHHFIRGYFDGDGCITGWVSVEKNKSDRFRYSFDICCKTKSLMESIQLYFSNHNIKININYLKRDDMYRIKTSSKKELEKIYHLLYDDANFYLSRKFNKFNHYVNTEVSQLIEEHRK